MNFTIRGKLKHHKTLIPWVLFILSCFVIVYLLIQISYKNNQANNPGYSQEDGKEDITKIIQAVGKLIVLPDEIPTVATITDLEKLKGQIFFDNAEVGDKVLIYIKAQKAILYSPRMNKIVELAPLNTSNGQGL